MKRGGRRGGGVRSRKKIKKCYVDVQVKTDQSDIPKVTVNVNRSLVFQTWPTFHMYCAVFGIPLLIEFFASCKLVIRIPFSSL